MYQKMLDFFNESKMELRKVSWPGRKEVTASSGVVIIVVVLFISLVVVVDWLIRAGIGLFFKI